MLVLSRKESQRIRLGEDIVITVVRLAGDKVRIGIDAPREMLVLRDELEPLAHQIEKPLPKETSPAVLPQLGSCCETACCVATN